MNRRIEEMMQGCIVLFIAEIVTLQFPSESQTVLHILMMMYLSWLTIRFIRGSYEE